MFTPEWVLETVLAYRRAENAKLYCKRMGDDRSYARHRRDCMRLAQLVRYAADRIIIVKGHHLTRAGMLFPSDPTPKLWWFNCAGKAVLR